MKTVTVKFLIHYTNIYRFSINFSREVEFVVKQNIFSCNRNFKLSKILLILIAISIFPGHPVVIGEWGWDQAGKGETWGHAFADWMKSNCMSNNFWWCLNPGKYGLMNADYKTGVANKLAFLRSVQPNPTKFAHRAPYVN